MKFLFFGKLSSIFGCEELRFKSFLLLAISFGAVAQFWLEHRTVTSEVEGSSPFGPANYTPVAEPDYESGKRNWS